MIRRSSTLALLCLVAAVAAPAAVSASPPDPVVSASALHASPPVFAPSLLEVVTIDLSRTSSFDIVMPQLLVERVVRVDSGGHELLKIAVSRVSTPSVRDRPMTRSLRLRAASNPHSARNFTSSGELRASRRYRSSALRDFRPARKLSFST